MKLKQLEIIVKGIMLTVKLNLSLQKVSADLLKFWYSRKMCEALIVLPTHTVFSGRGITHHPSLSFLLIVRSV
jgi:hypothetical protein